ncbi:hypothetical protein PABG_11827 [Paracoccidioides brasiliensis Pb03]|nr:hypothetical protein PABG_11827 [Paracoccidioides brasiliensis Pb03]
MAADPADIVLSSCWDSGKPAGSSAGTLLPTSSVNPHSQSLGGTPRLTTEFTAEFTKGRLGMKDQNTFRLREIIFDPTLILSPHVFLLGMLFHIKAFKYLLITGAETLYDLGVLEGLNYQKVPLRNNLDDKFVFGQAVREADAVHLFHELKLSSSSVRYRMKKDGAITGFEVITKPYGYTAKGTYNSLQNLVLQHSSIDIFLKHYLDRDITVDVLSIYRGLEPQWELMRLASSMSPKKLICCCPQAFGPQVGTSSWA